MRFYAVFRDQELEFIPSSENQIEDARGILMALGLPVSNATFRTEETAGALRFVASVPAGDKGA